MDANSTTLLEALQSSDEATRLTAVGELIWRVESYTRALGSSLMGLAGKVATSDIEMMRDLLASKQTSDDLNAWLGGHYKTIFQRIDQIAATSDPKAEVAPAKTLH